MLLQNASLAFGVVALQFDSDEEREVILPLYEYKCVKCGSQFEKIENVSAGRTKKCPKCGASAKRMASAPAIQFKGSGWYVTDYAGKRSDGSPKESKEAKEGKEGKEPKETSPAKPPETTATKESSKSTDKKTKKN